MKTKKTYVLDTNVLLTDPTAIYNFGNADVVIPFKVLEELDSKKQHHDVVGANARYSIRLLDSFREKGSLSKGVKIGPRKGLLYVRDDSTASSVFSKQSPDNQIIATALSVQQEKRLVSNDASHKVVVISRDINVRVKCDSLNLLAKDFQINKAIDDKEHLYTGLVTHLVDDQIIERFYAGESIYITKEERRLFPNQFVMMVSNQNDKKTALARFINYATPLRKLKEYPKGIWGVKPKNKEQQFALDLILDPKVPVVTLAGTSGTGKTLVALAACVEQVMSQKIYKKFIVMRPVQPVGKDIGFLPGTKEEKLEPFMQPIIDNLHFIFSDDTMVLEDYLERRVIEVECITYIRGRSIPNAIILLDESQSLNSHEIKTILTRLGEGSKIVITGDLKQIDNVYVNETTSGFTNVIEKFKDQEVAGHVTLSKGERSLVATIASKIL
jgi:PhoH-like ATPase